MISRKWVPSILKKMFGFEQRLNKMQQLQRYYQPKVEALEDRAVPAILFVDNTPGGTAAALGGIFTPTGGTQVMTSGLTLNTNLFTTISAAVSAANNGDTINVADGTYGELIDASKQLTIQGNQFGADARGLARVGATESIITNSKGDVRLTANNVTIDGFLLTGVTVDPSADATSLGVAVWSTATNSNIKVLNNVITNNLAGVFAESNGSFLIQHNLFDGNNQPGTSIPGVDIYVENSQNLTIDANNFVNNTTNNPILFASNFVAPAPVPSHLNVTVTNNNLTGNFGIFALGISGGLFQNNSFTANDPGGATALTFGGLCSNINVLNNFFNAARGLRINDFGVDFGFGGPYGDNTNIAAHDNHFSDTEFALGIQGGYSGTFDASANYWGTDNATPTFVQSQITVTDPDTVVDFTPWINLGAETVANQAVQGYQPDKSVLTVSNAGAQTGATGRIDEAVGLTEDGSLTGGARTINLLGETYSESPTLNASVTLKGIGAATVISPAVSANGINVTANNVTVRDLKVTANVGPTNDGISAANVSGLTIQNVVATGIARDGVHGTSMLGTTTITGGTFDANGDDGIDLVGSIVAAAKLVLNVGTGNTASGNGANGLHVQLFGDTVGITGWTFSNNTAGDGIHLTNVGAVSTTNVTASGNDPGIFVSGAPSFTDVNGNFSNNATHGIQLEDITGLASLTGTILNDNGGDGLNATDTAADADTFAVGGLTLSGVTVTETVAVGNTQKTGINVGNINGAVTFNDNVLVANTITGNTVGGVVLGAVTGLVSITSANAANYSANTGGDGIHIASLTGTLTVTGIVANANVGDGLEVDAGGSTATFSSAFFSNNSGNGINLQDITGLVSLTGVTANDNGGNGLNAVDGGDAGTLAVGALTVSGSTFNDTAAGNAQQLGISVGDIGGNVLFNDNGAVVNTVTGDRAGGVSLGAITGSVTFTTVAGAAGATYSNNAGDGLRIANGGTTADFTNGIFSGNTAGSGINLNSAGGAASFTGNVKLTNVTAGTNSIDGVHAINLNGVTTIDGGTYSGNTDDGLDLDGAGIGAGTTLIVSTNLSNTANANGDDGLIGQDFGLVTVTGWTFNNNGAVAASGDGIQLLNDAAVAITTVSASSNKNNGINLIDITSGVVITGVTANDNGGNGLNAVDGGDADTLAISGGGLTVSGSTFNDTAAGNSQQFGVFAGGIVGAVLFNDNGAVVNTVTGNKAGGVSLGAITGGANFTTAAPSTATYSSNTGNGISIASVTTTSNFHNITANSNTANGLILGNAGVGTIDGSFFNLNGRGIGLGGGSLAIATTTIDSNTLAAGNGAGIDVTGGSLTLNSGTVVTNNTATTGSGGGVSFAAGAGTGTIAGLNVTIKTNHANTGSGGGINLETGYASTVTVNGDIVAGATAIDGNTALNGGGISVAGGTLNLQNNASVKNNSATGSGGGINLSLGSVNFVQTLPDGATFFNTTPSASIDNNSAASGGGIHVSGGTLTVNTASITNNKALTTTGGGINGVGGIINVNASTLSGNTALTSGGGLNIAGAAATLQNVTVSDNTATSNVGGGLAISSGSATFVNDTIANNKGDGVTRTGGAVTTTNSIFALNSTRDFNGTITTDNGFNLFQNSLGVVGSVASDQLDKLARLAPLANYGGPTQTHALLPGSFALDTGSVVLAKDQRGLPRPAAQDIGAYESQGFVVTRTLPQIPVGDTAYRGLINNNFLNPDGSTPVQFALTVTSNDPNLTNLALGLTNTALSATPTPGGAITYVAPAAGASTNPATSLPVLLTNAGPVNSAQAPMTANAIVSPAGTPYDLFATTKPNPTFAAPGSDSTSWKLFNQKVTSLSYAASGFVTQVGTSGDGKIQITTSTDHLLHVGQTIILNGVTGNPAANGVFTVFAVIDATHFSLTGTVGAALVASDGIFVSTSAPPVAITTIASAVNSPIVITSAGHGLINGQQVVVTGVLGMMAANDTFTVGNVTANTFELLGSKGNAPYLGGGTYVATFGLAPQNAESGSGQFGALRFKNADGTFTKQYYVTLLDQDATPRPVVIDGQALSLQALIGGATVGVLNTIATAAGFPALTSLTGGIANATTERGIIGFTATRIFTSTLNATNTNAYQLDALYKNPDVPVASPPDIASKSSKFNIVPLSFTAQGGSFAGAQQTVLNVTILDSLRGAIRLVERPDATASGLGTNQLLIQAFDVGSTGNVLATSYNGPLVLNFFVNNININANVTIGGLAVAPQFFMTNGQLLLSDVLVNTALGDFNITAQFTLTDSAGTATVIFDTAAFSGGQFVRSNVGRQRGR